MIVKMWGGASCILMLFNPGANLWLPKPEALTKRKTLLVGPTGLLRHSRIVGTQHPLLQCCVKPACSQVQMLCRHTTFYSKWSGRQDLNLCLENSIRFVCSDLGF